MIFVATWKKSVERKRKMMARGRKEKEPTYRTTFLSRLGFAMRDMRRAVGISVTEMAKECGWTISHLSQVENGQRAPSSELVEFYEQRLGGDGLLLSLFASYQYEAEQTRRAGRERRRSQGGQSQMLPTPPPDQESPTAVPGDSSRFLEEDPPDGIFLEPDEEFTKTWVIQNDGTVPWIGRYLTRQGPPAGPGLMLAPRRLRIPDTQPGETVTLSVKMRAPRTECTSISYWKMTDETGKKLFFPGIYPVGLAAEIIVRRKH